MSDNLLPGSWPTKNDNTSQSPDPHGPSGEQPLKPILRDGQGTTDRRMVQIKYGKSLGANKSTLTTLIAILWSSFKPRITSYSSTKTTEDHYR